MNCALDTQNKTGEDIFRSTQGSQLFGQIIILLRASGAELPNNLQFSKIRHSSTMITIIITEIGGNV